MQERQIVEANRTRSDEVARRVKVAIEVMQADGERISFYAVAKRAQVARSTLYRRLDLRRLVEGAREERAAMIPGKYDRPSGIGRLEEELADVRRERDELREALDAMRPVRYRFIGLGEVA